MPAPRAGADSALDALPQFAAHLSGLTLVLPAADAWRAAEPLPVTSAALPSVFHELQSFLSAAVGAAPADTAINSISLTPQTRESQAPQTCDTQALVSLTNPALPGSSTEPVETPSSALPATVQPAELSQTPPVIPISVPTPAPEQTASPEALPTAQPAVTQVVSHPAKPSTSALTLVRPSGAARRAVATQTQTRRQTAADDSAQLAIVPAAAAPVPALPVTLSADADASDEDESATLPVEAAAPRTPSSEPDEPAAPSVTPPAGSSFHPQEMAFAARIQPVQSASQSGLTAEMASSSAVASANKKIAAAPADEIAAPAESHILTAAAPATEFKAASAQPAVTSATAPATPDRPAEAHLTAADTLPKTSAAPLKDIALQVSQGGSQRVDVRVVQQGGEVHVSVHSSDSTLTSGLRQGLSDLQSRLEENGYRSDVWRPAASTAPVAASPSSQSSTNHTPSDDGQSQSGGSQQESGRRNQNQSNQPRWVEELEGSLTSAAAPSGGFYGFSS